MKIRLKLLASQQDMHFATGSSATFQNFVVIFSMDLDCEFIVKHSEAEGLALMLV